MKIRRATLSDATAIAPLLLLAMEEIVYAFIGSTDQQKALQFMLDLVAQESNQYSYQNCFVAELDNQIVGALTIYDGAQLQELRAPVAAYIAKKFNRSFHPEDETQAGEYYLDSFGVDATLQGKGIGSALLKAIIEEYTVKQQSKVGLLVEKENPAAKKLYLQLGFTVVGEKTLVGKHLEHLQIG